MVFVDPYYPSSSLISDDNDKKYDVFISFRGKDTRENFTSHLHAALRRMQIEIYIDDRLEKGGEVWTSLVQAIKDSIVHLVIFSENYASSTWCLNEIVEIMDQCNNKNVIPVFYRVDPSHVRRQKGSYETAFAMHEKSSRHSHEKLQKWRDALFQAANLSGFHSNAYRSESVLIDRIVQMVLQKLNYNYTNELRGNFVPDDNYAYVESILRTQSNEVQIVGLWGIGGIGKTTIAAAIFQKLSSNYEGSCFLENVREDSERYGISHVFQKLLCELLQEDVRVSSHRIISHAIKNRLKRKKVFIVLDDVNTSDLLEALLGVGRQYLGAGSKVIVTSTDQHVLKSRAVDQIHQVKEMDYESSLKRF